MTSPKQRNANRLNAQRSSGPKSEEGRNRAAINAIKHGLTVSLESTQWGYKLADLETMLQSEGLGSVETHEIAQKLIEFERNVAYQRKRFQEEVSGEGRGLVIPEGAQSDLEIAAYISRLREQKQTHQIEMDRPLARQIQKFFEQTAARQVREANRDAAQELKNADRHLRRAANQLIKKLKSLGKS